MATSRYQLVAALTAVARAAGWRADSCKSERGRIVLTLTDRRTIVWGSADQSELKSEVTQALLEGFKQREIAENLGVSQQAVAARLRKIKDKLKGIIASM